MKIALAVDNRSGQPFPEEFELIVRNVIAETLTREGFDRFAEVSVSVVDDAEMRAINKKFRGVDAGTDVLSFPLYGAEELPGADDGRGLPLALGDIIIEIGRVFGQAKAYGHAPERELGFLTAHGALHLLGFDHRTPEEEKRMMEKQERILENLGLIRE